MSTRAYFTRHALTAAAAFSALAATVLGCSANDAMGERTGTSSQGLDYCAATVEGTDFIGSELSPVDWTAYHQSGRDFAFMKITQNTWIVGNAATFAANWAGAKSNSVFRIAYHFFDAT